MQELNDWHLRSKSDKRDLRNRNELKIVNELMKRAAKDLITLENIYQKLEYKGIDECSDKEIEKLVNHLKKFFNRLSSSIDGWKMFIQFCYFENGVLVKELVRILRAICEFLDDDEVYDDGGQNDADFLIEELLTRFSSRHEQDLLMRLAVAGLYSPLKYFLEFLSQREIDVNYNYTNSFGENLISCAAFSHDPRCLPLVVDFIYELEIGPRPTFLYPDGLNIFHILCTTEHEKKHYKNLIQGIDMNFLLQKTCDRNNMLHFCIAFNNYNLFEALLEVLQKEASEEFGSLINSRNQQGYSPYLLCFNSTKLFTKPTMSRERFIKKLLRLGVDVNETTKIRRYGHVNALCLSMLTKENKSKTGSECQVARVLISQGLDVSFVCEKGLSTLEIAVETNNYHILRHEKLNPELDINASVFFDLKYPVEVLFKCFIDAKIGTHMIDTLTALGLDLEDQVAGDALYKLQENMKNKEDQKSFVNLFHFLMGKSLRFFNLARNHGLLNKNSFLKTSIELGQALIFDWFLAVGFDLDQVINFDTCSVNRHLFSIVDPADNFRCHICLKPLETEPVYKCSTCEVRRCEECSFLGNDRIVTTVEKYLLNTKFQDDQLICLSSDVFNFVRKPLGKDLFNCIDKDNSMIRGNRADVIIQNAGLLLDSGLADKKLIDLQENKAEFAQKPFGSLLAKLELVSSETKHSRVKTKRRNAVFGNMFGKNRAS
eukprot:augustus_masked-scaffold_3-processed-gene-4.44-mRNA-1 protein AED:1.00 eAED:1.00 QI:0/-1/0/0/-1/1/1/0/714